MDYCVIMWKINIKCNMPACFRILCFKNQLTFSYTAYFFLVQSSLMREVQNLNTIHCIHNLRTGTLQQGLDPGERKGKEHRKGKQQNKYHKSVKSSEVIGRKTRKSFHLSLDPKGCFSFGATKNLRLQWVFCILDLNRKATLQPTTCDTIR